MRGILGIALFIGTINIACQGQEKQDLRNNLNESSDEVTELDEQVQLDFSVPDMPEASELELTDGAPNYDRPWLEGTPSADEQDALDLTKADHKKEIKGGVCAIYIKGQCSNNQYKTNTWFIDNGINRLRPTSKNYGHLCARRAIDYKRACKKSEGHVTARATGSNGVSVTHNSSAVLECRAKYTYVSSTGHLKEAHHSDDWGEIVGNAHQSNKRCAERSRNYAQWLVNKLENGKLSSVVTYRWNRTSKKVYGIWSSGTSIVGEGNPVKPKPRTSGKAEKIVFTGAGTREYTPKPGTQVFSFSFDGGAGSIKLNIPRNLKSLIVTKAGGAGTITVKGPGKISKATYTQTGGAGSIKAGDVQVTHITAKKAGGAGTIYTNATKTLRISHTGGAGSIFCENNSKPSLLGDTNRARNCD